MEEYQAPDNLKKFFERLLKLKIELNILAEIMNDERLTALDREFGSLIKKTAEDKL